MPSGATAIAGSQPLFGRNLPWMWMVPVPAEPGTRTGRPKLRPPSADRANPMPPQPIHVSYTYG